MKTSTHFLLWLTVLLLLSVNVMDTMAQGPYPSSTPSLSVCQNSIEPYGVNFTAGSSYAWSISDPTAGIIAAGATPNLITVNWTKPGDFTLQVVETNQYLCIGAPVIIQIKVNPVATIANKTATICSGDIFTINPVNGIDIIPAGTTYSWNAPVVAGITGLAPGSGAANISGTLTNTTNAPINVDYIVTPTSGTCTGASFTVTVTVNPKATIADKTVAAICSGDGFTVSPVNGTDIVPAGTTYSWSAPVVAGITGLTSGSSSATISGTLTNTTNAPIDVVYTVTPTSGSCSGVDFSVTVRVNPKATIADKTPSAICSGDGFTVSPVNGTDIVPVGTTYSWSAPVVAGITGLASGSGAANITGTLTNTTNAAINVDYIVTPTSGTCSGANFKVTVTVNPKATIADKTPAAICSGDGFTVSPVNGIDIVPAGTTYSWNAPVVAGITGLASGSGAANISGTLTNTTNAAINVDYIVTPTSGTCTGASFTVTVTVNPKATIADKTVAAICSGDGFTVSPVNGTDIVPAGTTYSWSAPVVAGITGLASGSGAANITATLTNTTNAPIDVVYNVIPTSGTCSGTVFKVTVKIYPQVNTSPIYHN